MGVFGALSSGTIELPARPARIVEGVPRVFAEHADHVRPRRRPTDIPRPDTWRNSGGVRGLVLHDVGENTLARRRGFIGREGGNRRYSAFVQYNFGTDPRPRTGWSIYHILPDEAPAQDLRFDLFEQLLRAEEAAPHLAAVGAEAAAAAEAAAVAEAAAAAAARAAAQQAVTVTVFGLDFDVADVAVFAAGLAAVAVVSNFKGAIAD